MRNHLSRKAGTLLAGLLLVGALASPAMADGTETLGSPSVVLASGSGFVSAGVGLAVTQPGLINFNVPAGSAVKQVLLYWEGQSIDSSVDPPDDTIRVEGIEVQGQNIGGPTPFYVKFGSIVRATAFRADITALNLVHSGANSLEVADLNFSFANDGAGVIVVLDNGTVQTLALRDGEDLAFRDFAPPLNGTVAQIFNFTSSTSPRTADLHMLFASVVGPLSGNGPHRPNSIEITVGAGPAQILSDPLGSNSGAEWDTLTVPVNIPAGATSLKIQAFSRDDLGSGDLPASLAWTASALSITSPGGNVCPSDGSSSTPVGTLITHVLPNGDVDVTFLQNKDNANDNTYGANVIGWNGHTHTFSNLVGSDNAGFQFKNGAGQIVFDFKLDYISVKSGTPSGYGSLGANGAEGKVLTGQLSWLLAWDTTLEQNLNNTGFCVGGNCTTHGVNLLVDSPPGNASYQPNDPFFTNWNYTNGYHVLVSHEAFGASGFQSISIASLHNSPSKGFSGTVGSCPENNGGSSFCTGDVKPKALTMQYTGESCTATSNAQKLDKQKCTGDPMAASPVRILATNKSSPTASDARVWFDGQVNLNGQFVINAANANKTRLDSDTFVYIYQGTTLKQSIKFHTSCSQPLRAGDQWGSIELIAFTPE